MDEIAFSKIPVSEKSERDLKLNNENLPGARYNNTYYFDLIKIEISDQALILNLMTIVDSWASLNTEVIFINASDEIKKLIANLNLEKLLVCK